MYGKPGNFYDNASLFLIAAWEYKNGDLRECERILVVLRDHIVRTREVKSHYHLLPEVVGFLDLVNELLSIEETEDVGSIGHNRHGFQ